MATGTFRSASAQDAIDSTQNTNITNASSAASAAQSAADTANTGLAGKASISDILSANKDYIVATPDATTAQKLLANVVLNGTSNSSNLAAAFTSAHPRVRIVGTSLQLDADVTITTDYAHLIFSEGLTVTSRANQGASTGTVTGAVQFQGSTPTALTISGLTGTIPYGEKYITHTQTGLGSTLAVGDYIQFQSTEVHNNNRPAQFFKGEFNRVAAVSDTQLVLTKPLRDSYDTTQLTINKLNLIKSPRITMEAGAKLQSHASSTSSYGQLLRFCDALHPQAFQVRVDGNVGHFASIGIGVWRSLNARIIDPVLDRIGDYLNSSAPLGYGIYIAGVENSYIEAMRAFECRHAIDFGTGGNNTYGQARYGFVIDGYAERAWAAGFSVHDGETITFQDCVALNCGGGFITRGPFTRWIRPVVRGTHQDNPGPYATHQSTTHGLYVGEGDVGQTTATGRSGEGLIIEEPDIDLRQGTSSVIAATAIYIIDPLVHATITGRKPLLPINYGLYTASDFNDDVDIDLVVDGSYQAATGTRHGVSLNFKSGSSTLDQHHSNMRIRLRTRALNAQAVYIAGGNTGQTMTGGGTGVGVSTHNSVSVIVESLGSAVTLGSPVVTLAGNYFSQFELEMDAQFTRVSSAVTGIPAGLNIFWKPSKFLNGVIAQSRPELTAPTSAQYLNPSRHVSSLASQAVVSGTLTLHEIEIPDQRSWDKYGIVVGTAEAVSAGTTVRQVVLYPYIAGTSIADFTNPLSVATVSLSATGTIQATFSTANLPPGKYLAGFFYYLNGATVTTAPLVSTINSTLSGPGGTPGSTYRGWTLTGLTALPSDNTVTPAPTSGNNLVVVGLRSA